MWGSEWYAGVPEIEKEAVLATGALSKECLRMGGGKLIDWVWIRPGSRLGREPLLAAAMRGEIGSPQQFASSESGVEGCWSSSLTLKVLTV